MLYLKHSGRWRNEDGAEDAPSTDAGIDPEPYGG